MQVDNTADSNHLTEFLRMGLFDQTFYCHQREKLGAVERDLFEDFVGFGIDHGLSPHPLFDVQFFKHQNPEAQGSGENLIRCFVEDYQNGRMIDTHRLFDIEFYLQGLGQPLESGIHPVAHYLKSGYQYGIDPHPLFSSRYYLDQNPDVEGSGFNPLIHFVMYGDHEGRTPHPLFHTAYYLASLKGERPQLPFQDFLARSRQGDHVDPHPLFDSNFYGSHIADLAGRCPAEHYVMTGGKNGVDPHPLFDTAYYCRSFDAQQYQDMTPLEHYLLIGAGNGLSPHPLFDPVFYCQQFWLDQNPDVEGSEFNPLIHFVMYGDHEGRTPHPLFHAAYYLASLKGERPQLPFFDFLIRSRRGNHVNPHPLFDSSFYGSHIADLAGRCPAEHYVLSGGRDVGDPHPLFDTAYYCRSFDAQQLQGMTPLEHYLLIGAGKNLSPHPLFDPLFYCQHFDTHKGELGNPMAHFSQFGVSGGYDPNEYFDITYYLAKNPDVAKTEVNPLVHFAEVGAFEGKKPNPMFITSRLFSAFSDGRELSIDLLAGATCKSDDPELIAVLRSEISEIRGKSVDQFRPLIEQIDDVRLIAFYLPQFHPIPENDQWWGNGFTEWTNVTQAQPVFEGHCQPKIPTDLGYYDLRVPEVMKQQAELARRFGIHGFCFYYYWFAGKRLLERPLETVLATGQPDFPFCLAWANENWTRRWDGKDNDILIAQRHSPEDDEALMRDVLRYFKSDNYIRVDGRPLFLLYRCGLLPDVRATLLRWRKICRAEGIGEIYLAKIESFEEAGRGADPRNLGFDVAVEFPPHQTPAPLQIPKRKFLGDFSGELHDYQKLILKYAQQEIPPYPRFRSVLARWDNTARQGFGATIFANSSPAAYQAWLEMAIGDARAFNSPKERFVFINAWNEWAEGAYLEPDQQYGHAYLEATRNALDRRHSRGPGERSE